MIHLQIITYRRAMSILDSLLARSRRVPVKSSASKSSAKKAPVTPPIATQAPAAKATVKKAVAKKATVKKVAAKKPAAKKAAPKKAAPKKIAAKKAAPKKAAAKKQTTKKSIILDVNKDGIVDEKDVELVKKAASKPKPKTKKSAFSYDDKKRFKNKTNRLGVRMNDVQIACSEIFGEKATLVFDKKNSKCYHIEIGNEKVPEIGIFSI